MQIRRVAHPGLAGVGGMFAIPDTRVVETCPVPADDFSTLFMPMEVAADKDFSLKRDSDVMMVSLWDTGACEKLFLMYFF